MADRSKHGPTPKRTNVPSKTYLITWTERAAQDSIYISYARYAYAHSWNEAIMRYGEALDRQDWLNPDADKHLSPLPMPMIHVIYGHVREIPDDDYEEVSSKWGDSALARLRQELDERHGTSNKDVA